jgi:hypothetical protein
MTRPATTPAPDDDPFGWEAEDEVQQAICPTYASGDEAACGARCRDRCAGYAALLAYADAFDAAARVSQELAEAARASRRLATLVRTAHHREDPPEVAHLAAYLAERKSP